MLTCEKVEFRIPNLNIQTTFGMFNFFSKFKGYHHFCKKNGLESYKLLGMIS